MTNPQCQFHQNVNGKMIQGATKCGMIVDNSCKTTIHSEALKKGEFVLGSHALFELKDVDGQHSSYWLPKCTGLHAMELQGQPQYVSISLGILKVNPVAPPLNACSHFGVQHQALAEPCCRRRRSQRNCSLAKALLPCKLACHWRGCAVRERSNSQF